MHRAAKSREGFRAASLRQRSGSTGIARLRKPPNLFEKASPTVFSPAGQGSGHRVSGG
jgi:hypothetical protein